MAQPDSVGILLSPRTKSKHLSSSLSRPLLPVSPLSIIFPHFLTLKRTQAGRHTEITGTPHMPVFSLKRGEMLGSPSSPTSDPARPHTGVTITADMRETVRGESAEMPELFLSLALHISGQKYSLLKERYHCTNFEKVCERFFLCFSGTGSKMDDFCKPEY